MRPFNKHFSDYTVRQVKRLKRDGWSFTEIGVKLGMGEREARTLARTKRVKAAPPTYTTAPRFEFVAAQPKSEATAGRSYSLAPSRQTA